MDYLLDTCTLLWAITNADLPNEIKTIIRDKNNFIYVSIISLWEIEIKHQKNPVAMPISLFDVDEALDGSNIYFLNCYIEHVGQLGEIIKQGIHNDPFDHMLLATAKQEKITLLTHDRTLANYKGVKVRTY